jgi:chemotaxis protein histidine kinase CheA
MSTTQVETVIVPTAAETATIHTVGDSVVLTVEDLAAFLPSLKGSVSSNVTAILSRYGYTQEAPKPVKAKKEKSANAKAATVAPIPECPSTEGVPTAADYRLKPEAINYSLCLGRMQQGAEDKRWSPFIYREYQCSKSPAEDNTLCKMCSDRHEKFVASGKRGQWAGHINQAPPDWWHMLGTKWAEEKQPKFNGATVLSAPTAAPVTVEVAAETVVQEQAMTTTAAPAKVTKAAEKEAAKAAKEAEKAAAKAAKEAEKEAAKTAKEAEKAAKKAAAPKKTAAKKAETVTTTPATTEEVVPAKADVTAEVAKSTGDIQLINGEMYMVNNGNVYEYDELTQKPGDFVGRLQADGTIDGDAEEVSADESDSE